MFRIGIGNDTHRLVEGRPLIIGGVQVAAARGAEGHSDADVLAHAIADSILGAICEGDLGVHFPDQDEQWKDADSLMLSRVCGWPKNVASLINLDSTVILEVLKLRPYMLSFVKIALHVGVGAGLCQCQS